MKCHYNERAERELQQAMCGVVQCDCQVCGDSDRAETCETCCESVARQLCVQTVF